MNIEQAKEILSQGMEDENWVARACSNAYVSVKGIEYVEPEMLEALELLREQGLLEQVPTPGQSRSEVCYRRAVVTTPQI